MTKRSLEDYDEKWTGSESKKPNQSFFAPAFGGTDWGNGPYDQEPLPPWEQMEHGPYTPEGWTPYTGWSLETNQTPTTDTIVPYEPPFNGGSTNNYGPIGPANTDTLGSLINNNLWTPAQGKSILSNR